MFTGSCICHDVLRILLCGQKSLNATSICLTHGTDFAESLVTVIRESVSRAAGSLLQQEDRFACGMRERERASERERRRTLATPARAPERKGKRTTNLRVTPQTRGSLGFQQVGSRFGYLVPPSFSPTFWYPNRDRQSTQPSWKTHFSSSFRVYFIHYN